MKMFDGFYNRIAKVYDLVYGAALAPGMKLSFDMMELMPGQKVLEVGIGTGLSLGYYPRNVHVTGIDIAEGMLAECQKKIESGNIGNVELQKMDAMKMVFPNNSFDRVFAPSVVSVIPQPERVVAEMLRVCKPDGMVCIVSHFAGSDLKSRILDSVWDPVTSKVGGFRMKTPASVVENAPGGIVIKKRPVTDKVNFNTVYVMRKVFVNQ